MSVEITRDWVVKALDAAISLGFDPIAALDQVRKQAWDLSGKSELPEMPHWPVFPMMPDDDGKVPWWPKRSPYGGGWEITD